MSLAAVAPPPARSVRDAGEAVARLAEGALVAFPTETVWGLAARAASPSAVDALIAWKGREAGQPLSILVPGVEALAELGVRPGEAALRLARALWPGPVTLVLRGGRGLAPGVAGSDGTLGLRCSSHPVARALVQGAWDAGLGPLTATSLNRSGRPPARTRSEAEALCAGPDAPLLLASGPDAGGDPPSTVVRCTDGLRILREGGVPASRILRAAEASEAP